MFVFRLSETSRSALDRENRFGNLPIRSRLCPLFAGDPGVGGRHGASDRKGVHGGSRGERRAHPADAEVRPQ